MNFIVNFSIIKITDALVQTFVCDGTLFIDLFILATLIFD
jgi:hypothetical protein